MDITGVVGLLIGFGLIIFGIFDGGKIDSFLSASSAAITIGGTIAATVCSFPFGAFKGIPKHFKIAFGKNKYKPMKYIETIVEFATDARRKGILSLEDKVNEQSDEFLSKSIMLIVDAIEPAKAKQILENELERLDERHTKGFKIYEKAAVFAPAFGMIGTLIGLINMLANLDMESEAGTSALTSGMAVALITTLYGSLFANLLVMPFASKLRYRHAEEMLCKEIVVEGVIAIQAGDNPKHIEERLYAYLNSSERGGTKKKGADGAEDDSKDKNKKGRK